MAKTSGLGVDWTLPGRKRRFASSTVATANLISILSHEYNLTWSEMYEEIHYDDDAKYIISVFIEKGFGDVLVKTMVSVY